MGPARGAVPGGPAGAERPAGPGRQGEHRWRGRAAAPGGGVAWRGGRGASKGRGGPSAQLPEPLSPGSRGPAALSPPGSLRSQQFGSSPRSPPLKRPGSRLGAEPRAVPLGMPRYELALILKAMQRVSDLPLRARLPARAPHTAARPPPLALPAWPAGGQGGGRASAPRGRAWAGRRGEAACAREAGVCPCGSANAGGCASHAAGRPGRGGGTRGAGRGAGSGSPAEGPREDTRERPAPLPSPRSCVVSGPAAVRSTSACSVSAARHPPPR